MRGKGSKRVLSHLPSRITPAYAGKSCVLRAVVVRQQDHPRLCGEKDGEPVELYSEIGITPAYAGKSLFL